MPMRSGNQPNNIVSTEANLGTLTWTGGGDPGGTTVKTYRYTVTGQKVDFFAKITCANAGTLNTEVDFALPAAVPIPATWAIQETSGLIVIGSGTSQTGVTTVPVIGISGLYDDGAGGFVVKTIVPALATKTINIHLSWIKA